MKNFFTNLFLFLLVFGTILGVGYLVIMPFDHYVVGGKTYNMAVWECSTDESSNEGEMGIWVSCSRFDGTKTFRSLERTFAIVDSRFDN